MLQWYDLIFGTGLLGFPWGGKGAPTGASDTGAQQAPLVARLAVDVDQGEYPLEVSFDTAGSELGTGLVRYEWSFGDGAVAEGSASAIHTYRGRGEFEAVLTLVDEGTGLVSSAQITIDVDKPDCPREDSPVTWGTIDDDLDAVSGIAASRRAPGLFWLEQDNDDDLVVVDSDGVTISTHDLPSGSGDLEDIALALDPETGVSWLFAAGIGDNYRDRDHVQVMMLEEPDPWVDSDLDVVRIELTYPDEPQNAETLLVDPLTLDLFLVTKDNEDEQRVFVKRAPHEEGSFELEDLGTYAELDMTATGGDVSADGARIVVRDYSDTARLFFRDAYEPFEEAFTRAPCRIDIFNDTHGEGIAFTADEQGLVTINEGVGVSLHYTEL